MGSNFDGKLGLNEKDLDYAYTPQLLDALMHSQVISISCGDHHSLASTKQGECYSWG